MGRQQRSTEFTGYESVLHRSVTHWPSIASRHWAEQFVKKACQSASIDAIVAIGSAVRGVAHARSDVDFVVIYHGEAPDLGGPPIDTDVRMFRRENVEPSLARGNDLLGWAVKYGVGICEQSAYWTTLTSRWANSLPLPSIAIAQQREVKARKQARDLYMHGDMDAGLELVVSMLTHRARARLSRAGVYPASRPELPDQLRLIGEREVAKELESALAGTWTEWEELVREEVLDERMRAGMIAQC